MKLPIGISDFKKIIDEKYQLVDKSSFIKDTINDGASVILIARPRRFGKTLNMSMLNYFLNVNQSETLNIFANLKISKDKDFCTQHQNKYPIIFISFKDIKEISYENVLSKLATLLSEVYEDHRYLLEKATLAENEKNLFNEILNESANQSQIENALKRLSTYLKRYYNVAPIVLIDEYDTPIQEAYFRGYYDKMIPFMRSILGQLLKDNNNLGKAVLTGITRVSQESLFSGLNNLKVYTLLNEEYGQYFGFEENEVADLLDKSDHEVSIESIKDWYNGYQIGKYVLYNPWSIINCLSNHGKLEPYWLNTASNELLAKLLSKADITVKQKLEELLQGKSIEQILMVNLVFTEIEKRDDALWSLLLYAGYLKVLHIERDKDQLKTKVAIPNKEVSFVYYSIVREWFTLPNINQSYSEFIKSLSEGNITKFKHLLATYIVQSGSYFDFNQHTSEQVFQMFILGLVIGLSDEYIIYSNKESGFGRSDLMLIPRDNTKQGIILEFKTSDTENLLLDRSKEALAQIKEKEYISVLKQHNIKSILAIGLAFCGKQVELSYENIEV